MVQDIKIADKIKNGYISNGRTWQYIAAIIASLSTFSTGNVLAWTAQISPDLLNGSMGFEISEEELGWLSSLMHLGAAFLSVLSGPITDMFGRKKCMIALALPMFVGWILLIFAQNIAMVYAGRFITGMVAGAYCLTTPLYTSEISEKEIRGITGSFTQLMISFGVFFVTIISNYLSIAKFSSICAAIPIVFAFLFVLMPESPLYLVKIGKEEEAKKALIQLRSSNHDIDQELESIKNYLKETSDVNGQVIWESLKTTAAKKACIIAMGLMVFRVWCAVDVVTVYASYIFKKAEVTIDEHTSTMLLAGIQSASSVAQLFVIDKLGRKILCVISALLITICLSLVGTSLMILDSNAEDFVLDTFKIVPVVALCIFYVGYCLGLGPIPWLICAEIFPQEIKSFASSVANFTNWIFCFVIVKVFLIMVESVTMAGAFFIFAGITLVGFLYITVFVHETKGKTLAEIQEELGGTMNKHIVLEKF